MGDFTSIVESVQPCGDLRRQEVFVDRQGVQIVALTAEDGAVQFQSMVTVNTTNGPLQIGFIIPGATIQDAREAWQAAAKAALTEAGRVMKENQRRIVLPSSPVNSRAPFTKHGIK